MKKLAVVGIGNLLLTDDGVGIHAVHQLKEKFPHDDILYVDQGTSIFELISLFIEYEDILILDALDADQSVGTLYKIPLDELEEYTSNKSSLHDVQVMDLYQKVKLMGHAPSVTVLAIQPAEVSLFNMELSGEMLLHFDSYITFIKNEISSFIKESEGTQCV